MEQKTKLFDMVNCPVRDLGNRAAWLAYRTETPSVGASELPVLYGAAGKDRSQYWLWSRRTTPEIIAEDATDEAETASWGNVMEAPILTRYAQKTGETVHPWPQTAVCIAPDFPGFCTPDSIIVDAIGEKIGEVKAWDENARWLWAEGIPTSVLVQVQMQMRVTGIHRAVVIVLFGNRINQLRTFEVEYDPNFGLDIEDRCHTFAGYVRDRLEPPVDESEGTTEALKRLHPDDNGQTIDLPDEVEAWTAEWHLLKAQVAEAESRLAWIGNKIRALLGDNTFGETFSGLRWSWKTQDNNRVDAAELRAKFPEAAEACTHNNPTRVLRAPRPRKGAA